MRHVRRHDEKTFARKQNPVRVVHAVTTTADAVVVAAAGKGSSEDLVVDSSLRQEETRLTMEKKISA